MKAISVRQPWAELIVSGKKKIEIRSWKTNYRGYLLIHASKVVDKEALKFFKMENKLLAKGAIVGIAYLRDIKLYRNFEDFLNDKELHLSIRYKRSFPVFGFVLEHVKRIMPIKYRGRLGLFEIKERKILRKVSETINDHSPDKFL